MLSLLEIKEKLSETITTFKRNQAVLEDYRDKLIRIRRKLELYDKYNPRNYPYISPTELSNPLPKGTISKVQPYINCYVSCMNLTKDFFTLVYFPVQNELKISLMIMEEIKKTINARLKTRNLQEIPSSDIFYHQRSASVEEKILVILNSFEASHDEVQMHFAVLTQWLIEFLFKDLTCYQNEMEHKTYFSRIYMKLTPNSEVDELAEFSNLCRDILQKYLNNSPASDGDSDKSPKSHESDISPDNMSLLLDEIALNMDRVHFDKENAKPNQQVSGLVLNT